MQEEQKSGEKFSYDVVGYPGLIVSYAHPDRLAVTARIYGMNSAPAAKCRVLELGCGTGTNLNWLAYNLPKSEFVGMDLAENHIVEAKQAAADLDLKNVEFFRQDVMEITEKTFGKFDYIIAQGLFSWVPDFVREKVLQIYDELLNPEGVGFISYNVYPGFYRTQIVRDIMRYHTERFADPLEKVKEGVEFIEFLTEQAVSPVFRELLKHELKSLQERPPENIYHDDLAEINQPFYFSEFIQAAEKHNLKFLSESEYFSSQKDTVSGEVAEVFEDISENLIEYEQFADFWESRRFRQTLLCKKDAHLQPELSPVILKKLDVSSLLKPASAEIDLNPESFKEFINFKGQSVDVGHNLTKVVLTYLVGLGAHLHSFEELVGKAAQILQAQGIVYEDLEKEAEITASLLLELYSPNAIGFHSTKPNAVNYISEKPKANKFAVWQANQGGVAVNFYGVPLNAENVFTRTLLNLLDGTRTREDLLTELTKIVEPNNETDDEETSLDQLPQMLDRDLFILAKMGFLVG